MKLVHRLLIFSLGLITILMSVVVAILDTRVHERIINQRLADLGREAVLVGGQWAATTDPSELVRHSSAALGGRVTLVGSDGVIIADAAVEGLSASEPGDRARRPEVRRALAGQVGDVVAWREPEEPDELYVAARTADGIVRVGIPTASMNEIFADAQRDLLTAGAAALAWAAVFALMFASYVSTPVMHLRDMAQRMARGEFRQEARIEAPGEVGELADSLQYLSGRLEKLESVRRDFIANVSHELCSPLTIAGGFASTLAKHDPPEDTRRQFARAILSNTQRMKRVIEDMLDLSRIESGDWVPRPVRVSVLDVTDEVFDSLGPAAAENDTELETRFDRRGIVIDADRTAVRQIIANLTENAIRHTTGGTIVVFSERTEDGTWLGVSDTGEGIPPQHLPRIFERMYRVDRGRARETGGSGLGLAIVKHMAEAHGGAVDAESRVGLGTTIRVFFPFVPAPRKAFTPFTPTRALAVEPAATSFGRILWGGADTVTKKLRNLLIG